VFPRDKPTQDKKDVLTTALMGLLGDMIDTKYVSDSHLSYASLSATPLIRGTIVDAALPAFAGASAPH